MANHLKDQISPYLGQHSENPVDWYPWCTEAFKRAEDENKPVFLSIGYSTCHWCHVMAHESFENVEVASVLNKHFISVKVDREERPDIDNIYMSVCRAFTGSGGWPLSIFMTPQQKPFFAGTYFPPQAGRGMIGFKELLLRIHEAWMNDREELLSSADMLINALSDTEEAWGAEAPEPVKNAAERLKNSYDSEYGGFGAAPKFPSPHNLLFLMSYYQKSGDRYALEMAEKTLVQMYRGGIFDHIGYGFCRYSTDRRFLVPHFEKMLCDNAMLMIAYSRAFMLTNDRFYKDTAEKLAVYIKREMTSPDGGFYSAQDADSDGTEGKYYLMEPEEINAVLGRGAGEKFCAHYGITKDGNFEGKSIPNLLGSDYLSGTLDGYLDTVYKYRRRRLSLHRDDKILTSWNSLMTAAFCELYRAAGKAEYLAAAERAQRFIEKNLCVGSELFVSFRDGKTGEMGFIDDYSYYIYALLNLYDVTYNDIYLEKAWFLCKKSVSEFFDFIRGGFYLYGSSHEQLIMRPKDTYDGALPSGNSIMTYNLIKIFRLTDDADLKDIIKAQINFMCREASRYPESYTMFLTALMEYNDPPPVITAVIKDMSDIRGLALKTPAGSNVKIKYRPVGSYKLKNNMTTFYVCRNNHCMPPVNDLSDVL
ncbi:MAG TPA: thioredoxin domain-containing protein [Candidatus Monoglobus merdigallinarum]|uniref:Thioredoxin domain-containing protein n=1 Tax=Candidatus Monoglobus merdigallinarum TaxID=2838698 RepID=A0A9D1TM96_9FIRM|nr:thioredoxin domain-containing protein [Candidatus Monoglobus merdigallinarum]